jgi:hypothetical protein
MSEKNQHRTDQYKSVGTGGSNMAKPRPYNKGLGSIGEGGKDPIQPNNRGNQGQK